MILLNSPTQSASDSTSSFTSHTLLPLLSRCTDMKDFKQIHAQMLKTGQTTNSTDPFPTSKLITQLLSTPPSPNNNNIHYARSLFDRYPQPNSFMWNIMLKAYSNSENPIESLHLYIQMLSRYSPSSLPYNNYTFPSLLKACCSRTQQPPLRKQTDQIHAHVLKLGFGSELYTTNSLIHVYAKSGDIRSAELVFNHASEQDGVTWNTMMEGYVKNNETELAFEMFKQIPDVEKNVVSWTTMMSCFVNTGRNREALELFHEMERLQSTIKQDRAALSSALSACSQLALLSEGARIHDEYIKRNGFEIDSILGCVLIDMYSKCGDLVRAIEVFEKLRRIPVVMNTPVWTAMITGLAIHGQGREAVNLFTEMEDMGFQPNAITFTAVLMGCSHAGMVEEGRLIFKKMVEAYGISPSVEHYGCMVDMLGRAGLMEEVKVVVERMRSEGVEVSAVVLGSVVHACKIHGYVELGKEIGRRLVEVDSRHGGRYVNLANMCEASGELEEAVSIRKGMREKGVEKVRGVSVVDGLDGNVQAFHAGEAIDYQIGELYP